MTYRRYSAAGKQIVDGKIVAAKSKVQMNREIAHLVAAAVEKYPGWSFGKILKELEILKDSHECDRTEESTEQLWARVHCYKNVIRRLGVSFKTYISRDNLGKSVTLMISGGEE